MAKTLTRITLLYKSINFESIFARFNRTKCNIYIIQMYVTVTQDDAKAHCSNLNLSLGVSN